MKPRLSGQNYITYYSSRNTKVGSWTTDVGGYTYEYCTNPHCKYEQDHEYAFDGQVFYNKGIKRKLRR